MGTSNAVPKGRLQLRHDRTSIDMYTIQHKTVYDTLATGAPILATVERSDYIEYDEFATAYKWMANELHHRRSCHNQFDPTIGAMFWFWANTTRRRLCAETKLAAASSTPMVLLRVRIPRERVLLSDFAAWHSPLNGAIAYTREQELAFAATCETGGEYNTELEQHLKTKYGKIPPLVALDDEDAGAVKATWVACLEDQPRKGHVTQGVTTHLEPSDIIAATHL